MFRDPETGKWRWKRLLLAATLAALILGPLGAYVGYRILFKKNPAALREIHDSEQRQAAIDDVFAEPAAPQRSPSEAAAPSP